jgi:formylglycine-generating enzyme required for sulfatase activity
LAVFFLAALLAPAVARWRESARRRHCVENLRLIGLALQQYHELQQTFPPAAVWDVGTMSTLMLFDVKRIDRIARENWAQLLLPHIGRADIAALFDHRQRVMGPANEEARTSVVPELVCPIDRFNRRDNFYGFQPLDDQPVLARFARGNYAINGGTHSIKFLPESTTQPCGESLQIVLDHDRRLFRAIGTGIAGINQSLKLADFVNGQATLVAVDEIRAGVHPLDLRGVWALGHIGSSITWAHGVVGDDNGPNNQWDRADDILDCHRLHTAIGADRLQELGMPCVWYVDRSQEATARSLHPAGVHVLFVDGAVRFIGDAVDRGLWHVMHSRETPAEVVGDIETALASSEAPPDAPLPAGGVVEPTPGETIDNSLGMHFVALPAGNFTMGLPDVGNDAPPPPECPSHEVRIPRAFWMGIHEVTQSQYQMVMESNPSHHLSEVAAAESTDDFPVENVTWYEAVEFCRRLSEMRDEKVAKRRYRLPTEAEWEYACRSGKSEPYVWNEKRREGDQSGDAAGIEPPLPITKVGSYPPNAFGLFDMRGNAWEWCADWFDRSYYSRSPLVDPQGPAKGYLKVVRGGDWIYVGETCRINYPIMSPWRKTPFLGFRVVCEVGEQSQEKMESNGRRAYADTETS